jgi:hypothetical protein
VSFRHAILKVAVVPLRRRELIQRFVKSEELLKRMKPIENYPESGSWPCSELPRR